MNEMSIFDVFVDVHTLRGLLRYLCVTSYWNWVRSLVRCRAARPG